MSESKSPIARSMPDGRFGISGIGDQDIESFQYDETVEKSGVSYKVYGKVLAFCYIVLLFPLMGSMWMEVFFSASTRMACGWCEALTSLNYYFTVVV